MKGYIVHSGYMGYIPEVGYTLFSTESEYIEYYCLCVDEEEK